jgi:hypothetical protein
VQAAPGPRPLTETGSAAAVMSPSDTLLERVMHSGVQTYRAHGRMVIPAYAGIQGVPWNWIPAYAGMTCNITFHLCIHLAAKFYTVVRYKPQQVSVYSVHPCIFLSSVGAA